MSEPTAKDAAFQRWMDNNLPNLKVYAKVFAEKFNQRMSDGMNAYRQMELFSANGLQMDESRRMVSALLRVYVTGHVR